MPSACAKSERPGTLCAMLYVIQTDVDSCSERTRPNQSEKLDEMLRVCTFGQDLDYFNTKYTNIDKSKYILMRWWRTGAKKTSRETREQHYVCLQQRAGRRRGGASVTSAADGDLNYRQTEAIASQNVPPPALPHTVPKYFPLLVW